MKSKIHENQKNNIKVVSKKLNTLLVIAFIAILTACSKDDSSENKKEANTYVVGYQTINGKSIATIWENGKPKELTDNSGDSVAKSVYVANNNVYVVGYKRFENLTVAKIWTNGVEKDLGNPTKNREATAVFVSGNDVYVVGNEYNDNLSKAKLWKNNIYKQCQY
jgi:hypothetical protein